MKGIFGDKRVFLKGPNLPRYKKFENEYQGKALRSIYYSEFSTQQGSEELRSLFDGKDILEYPKPKELIKTLISATTEDNDTILDFFAGSATTAQAVLEQNSQDGGHRKFILVQLPELTDVNSESFKSGYKTIAEIGKARIEKVINKLQNENEGGTKSKAKEPLRSTIEPQPIPNLGLKVFKLSPSNFKIWRGNEINKENLVTQLDAFTNPVKEASKAKNMLFELMLKSGYCLSDKVDEKENYYSVKDGELIIALKEMNPKIIDKIIADQPKKVITLDNLFKGNDQLKTNTVLQMKDAVIDFKTI
ncbi:MAG: hypothetical protein IPP15_23120 [Saprospiraceae bacterium]|uniref:site-specific DNA-methyltransferase (adenine-specific) n=1 Tax=Candidatus Opimibacter skivensis TaxID=2982028 RepID=A0A9D7T056_9BACT|nr:hypothetical protein [Candidatus Opimibacter skivensis]